MNYSKGSITAALGFLAAGLHCGIKEKNKDLALIYSEVAGTAAGTFTQNKIKAAPVVLTKKHIQSKKTQAIIINSGNANCCTGEKGYRDALMMSATVADALCIKKSAVLVASTGIIGKKLPIDKIVGKIPALVERLNLKGGIAASKAILTTDTKRKEACITLSLGTKRITIGAICKGAGMISPNMATMLGFITTDIAIDKKRLKNALTDAIASSFNRISVEGDMSTNDMVIILANGMAKNKKLTPNEFTLFKKALGQVCLALAKQIVEDAEGSHKFVEVAVVGAKNNAQAHKVAYQVANSPLVKIAIFGENPNWGRIAACVGAADKSVVQEKVSIYFGNQKVMHKGAAFKTSQVKLKQLAKKRAIFIKIDLGQSSYKDTIYTCDLSDKYVKINAEY